jgi:hypothetical protein
MAGESSAGENLGKVRRLLTEIRDSDTLCMPYQLPLESDGTAACKVFTTQPLADCACDGPNRAPVTESIRAAVITRAQLDSHCDAAGGPACTSLCVCENREAGGDSLTSCLEGKDAKADGWCYVSPSQGIGKLEPPCATDPQAQVRFSGNAALGAEERAYLACSDVSESEAEPRPLGAACVPSDESNPIFSGFSLGEVTVDTDATGCASGTCLVQNFQGRVTCPLGSDVQGGGDGACVLPGTSERVLVPVLPQLVARPPSLAATCSCRCAGPGDGPFCSCAEGQECVPLVADLGLPGDQLAGSYCVPQGAINEAPGISTCAEVPEQCSNDRPY